jgi:hypothetical protein
VTVDGLPLNRSVNRIDPTTTQEKLMSEMTSEVITKRVRLVKGGAVVLAVVLGIIIAFGRSSVYLEATEMLAKGVPVEATVVHKKHWMESGKKGREFDRYALVYKFTDGAGATVINEVRVDESTYAKVNEEGPVSVIYRASAPGDNDTRTHYEYKASITNIARDVLVLVAVIVAAGYVIGFLVKRNMQKKMAAQAKA